MPVSTNMDGGGPQVLPLESMSAPRDMVVPPALPPLRTGRLPRRRYTLLINPFYPKDPRASYGKHVLTPSLALTSIAGATPPHWDVRYWDENLLQGPPPEDPLPQVVGITVHLTFARRAYQLADWYRRQGCLVILGGLHVLSCPDEAMQFADGIAIGDGVQLWPQILADVERGALQPRYEADFSRPYALDPPPRRAILPRESFLTTSSVIATRGCHNRCGFCYLSTDGLRMPYRLRNVQQVVDEIVADRQPYVVFIDNNLGSRPAYLRPRCISAEAHEPRGARSRLCLVLQQAVFTQLDLDAATVRSQGCARVPGNELPIQALESLLASIDTLSPDRRRMAAPHRAVAAAAFEASATVGEARYRHSRGGDGQSGCE
jgi:hypothetical protein